MQALSGNMHDLRDSMHSIVYETVSRCFALNLEPKLLPRSSRNRVRMVRGVPVGLVCSDTTLAIFFGPRLTAMVLELLIFFSQCVTLLHDLLQQILLCLKVYLQCSIFLLYPREPVFFVGRTFAMPCGMDHLHDLPVSAVLPVILPIVVGTKDLNELFPYLCRHMLRQASFSVLTCSTNFLLCCLQKGMQSRLNGFKRHVIPDRDIHFQTMRRGGHNASEVAI
mmetsp:Transcript_37518/g.104311  ORF Transcript_37518/g.104311 Transcript_37518/m.104311 type:complete len:223 (-) Transcript_37518:116-784(-)